MKRYLELISINEAIWYCMENLRSSFNQIFFQFSSLSIFRNLLWSQINLLNDEASLAWLKLTSIYKKQRNGLTREWAKIFRWHSLCSTVPILGKSCVANCQWYFSSWSPPFYMYGPKEWPRSNFCLKSKHCRVGKW